MLKSSSRSRSYVRKTRKNRSRRHRSRRHSRNNNKTHGSKKQKHSRRMRMRRNKTQKGGLFGMVNKLKQLQQTHIAPNMSKLSPVVGNIASKMTQQAQKAVSMVGKAQNAIAQGATSAAASLSKSAADAHAAVNQLGDQLISHPAVQGASSSIQSSVGKFVSGVQQTVKSAIPVTANVAAASA